MSKQPVLKAKELIRALLKAGFFIHHQKGSHVQLQHVEKKHLRITVPFHGRFDLPREVVISILKQAELSKEELETFL